MFSGEDSNHKKCLSGTKHFKRQIVPPFISETQHKELKIEITKWLWYVQMSKNSEKRAEKFLEEI